MSDSSDQIERLLNRASENRSSYALCTVESFIGSLMFLRRQDQVLFGYYPVRPKLQERYGIYPQD